MIFLYIYMYTFLKKKRLYRKKFNVENLAKDYTFKDYSWISKVKRKIGILDNIF